MGSHGTVNRVEKIIGPAEKSTVGKQNHRFFYALLIFVYFLCFEFTTKQIVTRSARSCYSILFTFERGYFSPCVVTSKSA